MADFLKPDLCILGAGALGTALAIKARTHGLSVVLVRLPRDAENDPTGGSLKRQAVAASAERAHLMRSAGMLGFANTEPKLSFRVIGERAASIAEAAAPRDSDARLAALGVDVRTGEALFTDRQTLRCGEAAIRARHYALAMGGQPVVPPLPGLDAVSYFTPDTIGDATRKLSHLVVIGGTPEAFELAQTYRRLGSSVTLVPQGGLLPGFDPELVALLLRQLREEGMAILDDAEVASVVPRSQGTGIVLRRGGGEDNLDVSHILLAMGRRPDLDGPLLEAARLVRDRDRPEHLALAPNGQTSNRRITALGGTSGHDAPQVETRQLSLLVQRLLGRGRGRHDPLALPQVVATQPSLAQFGLLDPGKARRPKTVLRSNLVESDARRADGTAQGVAKLVVEADGTIIAAGIIGSGAADLAAMLALAAGRGLRLDALDDLALSPTAGAAVLLELAEQFASNRPAAGWRGKLPLSGRR